MVKQDTGGQVQKANSFMSLAARLKHTLHSPLFLSAQAEPEVSGLQSPSESPGKPVRHAVCWAHPRTEFGAEESAFVFFVLT